MDRDVTVYDVLDRLRRMRDRLNHYDLLLAVIPISFVIASVVAGLTGISLEAGLIFAALLGALAVIDGLFVHPPSEPGGI